MSTRHSQTDVARQGQPAPAEATVLVIEDDPDTRENLCDILELDDHRVDAVGSLGEALSRDNWANVTTVILDGRLPDGTAEEFLPRLRQLAPHADVVVATGFADLNGAIAALRHGAADYIVKPINPNALRASLLRAAERRRLAQAKARSDAAFRTLIEAAPSMTVILDAAGKILYFSPFAEKLTGYRAAEVLGKNYAETFAEGTAKRRRIDRRSRDTLSGKATQGYEDSVRCKDGSHRWVVWNVERLEDFEGQPGVLRVGQDITDRKLAEEALVKEKDFVESLIEQAQAIVLLLDAENRIVRFNPFLESLSGIRLADAAGKNWLETFVAEEERDRVRRIFDAASDRGAGGAVAPFFTVTGRRREIKLSSQTLRDAEGKTHGVLVIGHDVTELHDAQRKALQAERLAAIGQMMTGLTHESRNALQRSKACLEMLALEIEDRPEAVELVHRIEKAQEHLQQLFEEVRGYAAPIKLKREPCDLRKLWQETWSHLAASHEAKKIGLEDRTGEAELHCQVDPFALGQVVRNIFENALQVTPEGGQIVVRTGKAEIDGRPGVWIGFHDSGPGLDPEQRARIFEPFFTTKAKGTGLGMAIARRIMQSHGGQIEVGSRPDPGAEIVLILPRDAE